MVEEVAYGIIKVIACILRFIIEAGLDFGIRGPGKLMLKILWPPYWIKKVSYEGPLIDVLGLFFYLVLFYFVVEVCCP